MHTLRMEMKYGETHCANAHVQRFVEEYAALCQPDRIFWCDGSIEEKEHLTAEAVAAGVLVPLNQEKLPGCYYHRSNENDVARVEQCTFICTPGPEEAGPTNNWADPREMTDLPAAAKHSGQIMLPITVAVRVALFSVSPLPASPLFISYTVGLHIPCLESP